MYPMYTWSGAGLVVRLIWNRYHRGCYKERSGLACMTRVEVSCAARYFDKLFVSDLQKDTLLPANSTSIRPLEQRKGETGNDKKENMGPTEEHEESTLPLGGKHDQIETHSDQQKHRPLDDRCPSWNFLHSKNFTGFSVMEPLYVSTLNTTNILVTA